MAKDAGVEFTTGAVIDEDTEIVVDALLGLGC